MLMCTIHIKLYTIILTRTETNNRKLCIKYVSTQKGSKIVHFAYPLRLLMPIYYLFLLLLGSYGQHGFPFSL